MTTKTDRISVVSGYFNPIHVGHIRLIRGAKKIGPHLVVIVNNDRQQLAKKGRIIIPENDRLEIVSAIRDVDHAFIATDSDSSVVESLAMVRNLHPDADIYFCNGGDRSARKGLGGKEAMACERLGIRRLYGVGGEDKPDSSTRICAALESCSSVELTEIPKSS